MPWHVGTRRLVSFELSRGAGFGAHARRSPRRRSRLSLRLPWSDAVIRKARWLVFLLAVLAIAAPGCKARDEWKISVETNIAVPQFGDRLYIEVMDDSGKIACDDCARQFGPLTA